jgi:hypothetical protein
VTLAIVSAIFIAIAGYILYAPISFETRGSSQATQKPISRIRIFPFFRFTLKSGNVSEPKKPKPGKIKSDKPKNNGLFKHLLSDWDILLSLIFNSLRLISGLFRSPDKVVFDIELSGGFEQPHLTGEIFGIICAVKPVLPNFIKIDYQPDFSGESSIIINYDISLTIHLAAIFGELCKFIFRLPISSILRNIWNYRKESQYAY